MTDETSLTYEEFMRRLVGEPEQEGDEEPGPKQLHRMEVLADDREFSDLLSWLKARGIHGRFHPTEGDRRNAEESKQGSQGR